MPNSKTPPPQQPPVPAPSAPEGTAPVIRLSSQQLLRGQRSVVIEHLGTEYRLQATKLGKLILTK